MMDFCVTLSTVHATQGQGQAQDIIVFYCAHPVPCPCISHYACAHKFACPISRYASCLVSQWKMFASFHDHNDLDKDKTKHKPYFIFNKLTA